MIWFWQASFKIKASLRPICENIAQSIWTNLSISFCCFIDFSIVIIVVIVAKIIEIKILADIIIAIFLLIFFQQLALREHILIKLAMSLEFFHTWFKLLFVLFILDFSPMVIADNHLWCIVFMDINLLSICLDWLYGYHGWVEIFRRASLSAVVFITSEDQPIFRHLLSCLLLVMWLSDKRMALAGRQRIDNFWGCNPFGYRGLPNIEHGWLVSNDLITIPLMLEIAQYVPWILAVGDDWRWIHKFPRLHCTHPGAQQISLWTDSCRL